MYHTRVKLFGNHSRRNRKLKQGNITPPPPSLLLAYTLIYPLNLQSSKELLYIIGDDIFVNSVNI
jgi:hypothetical protein